MLERRRALLGVLVACTAGASPSRADPVADELVAVLSVDLRGATDSAGELPRAVREAFAERMRLLPPAEVAARLEGSPEPGCTSGDCARRLARAVGARWLVRARVDSSGSDYELEVAITDGSNGWPLPPLKDRCTLCGWAEVGVRLGALARAGVSLVVATRSVRPPPPPSREHVPPLSPAPRRRPVGLTVAKWLTAATAVGLLATAGVLFSFDGRGTCNLPAGSEGLRCPRHYDTALEGGLFIGAGAVAGAASGTLFWLDHRRARIAPAATVGAKAMLLGLVATF